ncbi:hypothetical protein QVD17_39567 [Tagetes erecta]|uniref:Reverse transcriptase zinc-binding domain-containing protein n=1 Tax=Tagetes erecta TaxID=13708 RepID=A0AAD8JR12_TARER|nr:hypothetical protein QVD17_39567 [Tagetes erecta]
MSCGWRNLLRLRVDIRPFIWSRVGNGALVNVWSDNWCCYIPLRQHITPREIYRAGFDLNDKLVDMVDDRQWVWPSAWYDVYPFLINIPIPEFKNMRDGFVWKDGFGVDSQFSVSKVWDDIRKRKPQVCWSNAVWFPKCIPRHAFHMWLVFKGKLNTQDRLKKWDMNMMCYALCSRALDSHEHLFFECNYSQQVWKLVRHMIDMDHTGTKWEDIVGWIIPRIRANSARSIIERLVISALAYYIWQERNARTFRNELHMILIKRMLLHSTHEIRVRTGAELGYHFLAGFLGKDAEQLVADCYHKKQYMLSYAFIIPPLSSDKYWPVVDYPLDPPPIKAAPGRPKKNRRRDPHENPKRLGNLTKHGTQMTCSKCKGKGHNIRSCKEKSKRPLETVAKRPKGRPKKQRIEATQQVNEATQSSQQATQQPTQPSQSTQKSKGKAKLRGKTN